MSDRHYPSDDAAKFMFRMPVEMHARIKAEAVKNHRSMNAEILYRLECYEKLEDFAEVATRKAHGDE